MSRYIFDIETDGLLDEMTKIHCIVIHDLDNGEVFTYYGSRIEEGVVKLSEAKLLVGHNIIDFDIPAIKKLYSFNYKGKVTDTLVLSRLAYPDIKKKDFDLHKQGKLPGNLIGRHSLESWGYRLGEYKGEFSKTTDWKEFSQEMLDYCIQDVGVNYFLHVQLLKVDLSPQSVNIEQAVQEVISEQIRHGFCFDLDKAQKLFLKLTARKETLEYVLSDIIFKPCFLPQGEFTPKRDCKKKGYQEGRTVTKIKLVKFNPASRQHIAYWLMKKYDWMPTQFTPTGEPKVDETILSGLRYKAAQPLIEYFIVDKRIGQLQKGPMAWMTKVHQGRIHGYVNTNGAVTGRMTHSNPNIAQVPSCGKPYGAECRELFYAPEGYNLVGFDVSGLELRCLANYIKPRIKEGEFNYVREILEGDVHTTNQQTFGFPGGDKWRNVAKTFIYALIYGAGDAKLGKISGKGAKEGRNLKRRLFDKVPALDRLKKQIDSRLDDVGYLKGLDGRKLRCRSKRSALNTLLQSAGAVIMKVLLVIVYKKIREQGLTVHFVANIHDEFQMEVKIQDTQYLRPIFDQSLLETQEWLRLKVPLEGKLIVGKNWKETH